MTEIGKRGLDACLDEAFEIALDECDAVFLSVDIDVCDPGHAPGTGTPEPGGLSSRAAARRRTPDLPRAAGRRHRRRRGLAALRPRRDHGVPRQPGRASRRSPAWPRGRSACTTTPPARCWTAADDGHLADPGHGLPGRRRLRRAPVPPRPRAGRPRRAGCVRCCRRPTWPTRCGPAPRSSTWPGGWCARASSTPTSTRSRAGWSGSAATCPRPAPARSTSPRSAAYAAAHPDAPWILGGGWAMSAFPGGTPTAADLDAVVPDRPVFLPNRDHHGAWVNTRALEVAGIDARHLRPAGRADRARRRRPPHGHACTRARWPWSPGTCRRPTGEEYYARAARRAVLPALARRHRLAGRHRRCVRRHGRPCLEVYLGAARNGDLARDVVGALWWDRDRGVEQVEDLCARRRGVRPRPVPGDVGQDHAGRGGRERHGGAGRALPRPLRARHRQQPGTRSSSRSCCARRVARLRRRGLPGARARDRRPGRARGARRVRARPRPAPGPGGDRRHHIAHLQLVHPADVQRFAALGVAANMQALWACLDEQMVDLTLPFLGEERAGWQYPFGDLLRARAPLACGSDWPVSTPDPLAAIHIAVTRTAYGDRGRAGTEPFLPRAGTAHGGGVRGVHLRLGPDQPPRRRRRAAARCGGRPGGARPGPVHR